MFKASGTSSSIWKGTQTWHLKSIFSPLNLLNLDKPEGPRISLPLAKAGPSKTDNDNENNNALIYNLQCLTETASGSVKNLRKTRKRLSRSFFVFFFFCCFLPAVALLATESNVCLSYLHSQVGDVY